MHTLSRTQAKRLWIQAQGLSNASPFGAGVLATQLAVEHLGYVQIDTINVIERSHHHILYSRIPHYRPSDLHSAQSKEKSVFEYWAHALAYLPTRDYRFYLRDMRAFQKKPTSWYQGVTQKEVRNVLKQIKDHGPLSIREMEDEELIEKDHPWASRKPSKKALQYGFYAGSLVVSERVGMLKKYELAERYFAWTAKPKVASEAEISSYLLDRALRSQSVVSLDSICYLNAPRKKQIMALIEKRVKAKRLVEVKLEGAELKNRHWISAADLDQPLPEASSLTHLLSPFDPLVIQRKRLELIFEYQHRFEAYLPKEKRKFGYFALPVLVGENILAALDLKTDRREKKLLIQKWTWLPKTKSAEVKREIEASLHLFENFQLGRNHPA